MVKVILRPIRIGTLSKGSTLVLLLVAVVQLLVGDFEFLPTLSTTTTTRRMSLSLPYLNKYTVLQQEEEDNPFQRVILMIQLNHATMPAQILQRWIQTVEPIFGKVLVRGEFWNATRVEELNMLGMDVRLANATRRQSGFYTPMTNLRSVLWDYRKDTKDYDGVLYLHDDSIPNLKVLSQGIRRRQDRMTTILGTDLGKPGKRHLPAMDLSYQDPRPPPDDDKPAEQWTSNMKKLAYRIYPLNTTHPFTDNQGGNPRTSFRQLNTDILERWNMRPDDRCMGGQYALAKDPLAQEFYEGEPDNPYMTFPPYTQADLLYVPLQYAETFARLSDLLDKHGVWIECGLGTIVDQLRRLHQAPVQVVPLCTSWNRWRGKPEMLQKCRNAEGSDFHGFFHPIKGGLDMDAWERLFEEINGDWIRNSTMSSTTVQTEI